MIRNRSCSADGLRTLRFRETVHRSKSMPPLQHKLSESSKPKKQDHQPEFCPISQDRTANIKTPCNHFFNEKELKKWINTTNFESSPICPTCQTPLHTMKRLSYNMSLKIVDYSRYNLNDAEMFEKFKVKLVEDRNKFFLDFLNTNKKIISINDQLQHLDKQLSKEKLSECENILGKCYMEKLNFARENQQQIFK